MMFPQHFWPAPQYTTPPAVGQTIVQLYTRDQTGATKAAVVVKFQIAAPPAGKGSAFDATVLQVTSDHNGLISTALPIGATVRYWANVGRPTTFVVPASGPYSLDDIVGTYGS